MKHADGCRYMTADGRIEYELIRMNRKSLAIHISEDGKVMVKAPVGMKARVISDFICSKQEWIEERVKKAHADSSNRIVICEGATVPFRNKPFLVDDAVKTRRWMIEEARSEFEKKAGYYSQIIGVSYNRIAVREQKTRWGSCSSGRNLNFNWKLIMMPEKVLDYVVIHELSHLKEMNHSKRFWNIVAQVCPEYMECRRWLKDYGGRFL